MPTNTIKQKRPYYTAWYMYTTDLQQHGYMYSQHKLSPPGPSQPLAARERYGFPLSNLDLSEKLLCWWGGAFACLRAVVHGMHACMHGAGGGPNVHVSNARPYARRYLTFCSFSRGGRFLRCMPVPRPGELVLRRDWCSGAADVVQVAEA